MVLNIPGPGTRKPVGKSRTTLSIERSELGSRGLSALDVGSSPAEVEARGVGVPLKDSSRWQQEPSVPAKAFERFLAEKKGSGEEITQQGLLDLQGGV